MTGDTSRRRGMTDDVQDLSEFWKSKHLEELFKDRGPITHEEARNCAEDLIDHFFKNAPRKGGGVLISIPVRSDNTDVMLIRYIDQAADHIARLERQIKALREENAQLQDAIDYPRKYTHRYWRAGEPDCPADIKAGNGELHTLRCKLCGSDNSMAQVCPVALKPPCKNHPDRPTRENLDGDNLCQECCDQWVRGERPQGEHR